MQDRGFRKLSSVSWHIFKYFVNNNVRFVHIRRHKLKTRKGSINGSGQRSKQKQLSCD